MRKMMWWVSTVAMVMLGLGVTACSTTPSGSDQPQLLSDAATSYGDFTKEDPTLDKFVKSGHAYAIFPNIGKGAIGIGGAYRRGVVYEQGSPTGWTDMTQGTLGVQLGGQSYAELIVFKDKTALNNFESGDFSLSAQASAVAASSGAAAAAKYDNGVVVFVRGLSGLMFEASVGGQSFGYRPMNQDNNEAVATPSNPAPPPPASPTPQQPTSLEPPPNNTVRPPSNN